MHVHQSGHGNAIVDGTSDVLEEEGNAEHTLLAAHCASVRGRLCSADLIGTTLLARAKANLVARSRPFIRQPNLISRMERGSTGYERNVRELQPLQVEITLRYRPLRCSLLGPSRQLCSRGRKM